MAFQFPLQTLLCLREAIEERERIALEVCLRELNELRAGLKRLHASCETRRTQQRAQFDMPGISGAELHFGLECQYSEALALQQIEHALSQSQNKCEAQRQRYSSAHRSRELLENLRDQQRDAFTRDQVRREQNAADDLFLARMGGNSHP